MARASAGSLCGSLCSETLHWRMAGEVGLLATLVRERLRPERIVLRLSRNIQAVARQQFRLEDGQIIHGGAMEGPVVFRENGLAFEADVLRGQKTGFFLDQRENRSRVGSLARDRDVLNAFSFSGGFSVYCARGGARSVTDLDLSAHALAGAGRNLALNSPEVDLTSCRHLKVKADAFEWLARPEAPAYDLVVLDPPSLARRESERSGALRAYASLAKHAIRTARREGILVMASCWAHVGAKIFETILGVAARSGRDFAVLQTTRQPKDHPATFREAEYLKCIYLGLDGVVADMV